jgi:protein gp37
MSEKTNIEWTDHTWNPWRGCTKVSPGCANCYAETLSRRNPAVLGQWGKGKPRVKAKNYGDPLKWERRGFMICPDCNASLKAKLQGGSRRPLVVECCTCGSHRPPTKMRRQKVFPSLCDWLDDEVPIEWLSEFLQLIHDTPNLDWLLLSKRPESFFRRLSKALILANGGDTNEEDWFAKYGDTFPKDDFAEWLNEWIGGRPPSNIWIGVSVEDQPRADERIPELLKIPARVHFLSAEPLLGPVDFFRWNFVGREGGAEWEGAKTHLIDWVIIGGESGPGARPCNVEWIRDIMVQCYAAEVAPFVKQLGKNPVNSLDHSPALINHPKGGDPAEWPEDLRRREFPEVGGV